MKFDMQPAFDIESSAILPQGKAIMTKAEFIVRFEIWRKHEIRNTTIALCFPITSLVAWIIFMPRDWAAISNVEVGLRIAAGFAILIMMPLLVWLASRLTFRKYRVVCPVCGKPMGGVLYPLALATSKCGHCGEHIFEDVSV